MLFKKFFSTRLSLCNWFFVVSHCKWTHHNMWNAPVATPLHSRAGRGRCLVSVDVKKLHKLKGGELLQKGGFTTVNTASHLHSPVLPVRRERFFRGTPADGAITHSSTFSLFTTTVWFLQPPALYSHRPVNGGQQAACERDLLGSGSPRYLSASSVCLPVDLCLAPAAFTPLSPTVDCRGLLNHHPRNIYQHLSHGAQLCDFNHRELGGPVQAGERGDRQASHPGVSQQECMEMEKYLHLVRAQLHHGDLGCALVSFSSSV